MEVSKRQLLELAKRLRENREIGSVWTEEQVIEFFMEDMKDPMFCDRGMPQELNNTLGLPWK